MLGKGEIKSRDRLPLQTGSAAAGEQHTADGWLAQSLRWLVCAAWRGQRVALSASPPAGTPLPHVSSREPRCRTFAVCEHNYNGSAQECKAGENNAPADGAVSGGGGPEGGMRRGQDGDAPCLAAGAAKKSKCNNTLPSPRQQTVMRAHSLTKSYPQQAQGGGVLTAQLTVSRPAAPPGSPRSAPGLTSSAGRWPPPPAPCPGWQSAPPPDRPCRTQTGARSASRGSSKQAS